MTSSTHIYNKRSDLPVRMYIKSLVTPSGRKIFYFGITTTKNIEKYKGSGKIWRKLILKWNQNPKHEWNSDWYVDSVVFQQECVKFSIENNIVSSRNWVNLIIETGTFGAPLGVKQNRITCPHCSKTGGESVMKAKHFERCFVLTGVKQKFKTTWTWSQESKKAISEVRKNYNVVSCPHCNKVGAEHRMHALHFDRCFVLTGIKPHIIKNRKKQELIECEYCNKVVASNQHSRWHGEKCKYNI
jgi:phage FluMu protein Com